MIRKVFMRLLALAWVLCLVPFPAVASPMTDYLALHGSCQNRENLRVQGMYLVYPTMEASWDDPVFILPGGVAGDPKVYLQPVLAGMMPIPAERVDAFLERNRRAGELLPTLFFGSVLIALSGLVRRQIPRQSPTVSPDQG
jgi:hypothetical protein